MGTPTSRMRLAQAGSGRRQDREKEKGRAFRRMSHREQITLTAWAETVAMAAPAAPMPRPPTRRRSPAMLTAQAIATVISGVLESPIPRKTAPITL